MALSQRIQDDLKAALLGGDRFVAETLRGLRAAVLNVEVSEGRRESGLSDSEIEQIIAKEVKRRNEAATVYEENNRKELAETELHEADILRKYLPEQLSEDALKEIINKKIAEVGVTDLKMMGQVIGLVKNSVGNSADGALVAKLVKEALN